MKIRFFTDLNAWKEGHQVVIIVYEMTQTFPKDERFGLVNQMRRCAISITSNIAEGFARHSRKESMQFFYISLGSVAELQNQIIAARDLGFLNQKQFDLLNIKLLTVNKLLNGLIKSSKNYI